MVMLAGCEGSSTVDIKQPMMVRLTPFNIVAVSVGSPQNQWLTEAGDVEARLARDFRESLMFKQVTQVVETGQGVPEDQINVMVELIEVHAVDGNLRWTVGPFAGQAKIVANVEVVQASTGVTLGQSSFDVLSDAMTTRTGTTQDVVGELSRQIVMWVGQYK